LDEEDGFAEETVFVPAIEEIMRERKGEGRARGKKKEEARSLWRLDRRITRRNIWR
jgi:predicted lipid-binding transport protein (Tim44 family)